MRRSPIYRPRSNAPVKGKRRKGPLPFRYVFIISFLIFCFLTVQGLIIVEAGIRPTLVEIAKTETQRIGTLAINDAMSKKVMEDIDVDEILQYNYDDNGRLQAVSWNVAVYWEIQHATVRRVQNYLNDIEHGRVRDYSLPTDVELEQEGATFTENGIVHTIPLGQATNNSLLAHLGPRVPVRFSSIGDVKADLKTEVIETGINNTYLQVSVEIEVDVQVIIPFATDTEVVKTSIVVANIFHAGEVPEFYSSGGEGMNPAILQSPTEIDENVDLSGLEEVAP
ncbi:sporulation protein YunB [Evansella sp. AB-rgal1]|uniref:sporulation protein YunB n=1 Tax=Evansella sp. AB-rgal1 TaxID=3242696 RepID=UPI00359E6A30